MTRPPIQATALTRKADTVWLIIPGGALLILTQAQFRGAMKRGRAVKRAEALAKRLGIPTE